MTHRCIIHLKRSTSRGTMKLCVVLLLFLADPALGDIEKRIVGAQSCKTERQYHVKIDSVQGGKTCGGALLNPHWVITASHCAEQQVKVTLGINNDVSLGKKIKSWFKGSSKKLEQVIGTEQQFTYKDEEGKPHDIMLIKLNENMSKLPTIDLPSQDCKRPDLTDKVMIGGMGPQKAGKKPETKLRCATTEMNECGENDKADAKYHGDEANTMCAFKPGVEACFGDAGSAVEYQNILHGITISDPVDKCANPIVMLDICFYREWIKTTMMAKSKLS